MDNLELADEIEWLKGPTHSADEVDNRLTALGWRLRDALYRIDPPQ